MNIESLKGIGMLGLLILLIYAIVMGIPKLLDRMAEYVKKKEALEMKDLMRRVSDRLKDFKELRLALDRLLDRLPQKDRDRYESQLDELAAAQNAVQALEDAADAFEGPGYCIELKQELMYSTAGRGLTSRSALLEESDNLLRQLGQHLAKDENDRRAIAEEVEREIVRLRDARQTRAQLTYFARKMAFANGN